MAYFRTPRLELEHGQTSVYARRGLPRSNINSITITLMDIEGNPILRIDGDIAQIAALGLVLSEIAGTANNAQQERKSRWEMDYDKEIKV